MCNGDEHYFYFESLPFPGRFVDVSFFHISYWSFAIILVSASSSSFTFAVPSASIMHGTLSILVPVIPVPSHLNIMETKLEMKRWLGRSFYSKLFDRNTSKA